MCERITLAGQASAFRIATLTIYYAAIPGSVPMSEENEPLREDDLSVQEADPEVKEPPLYRVILLNDDYTPMEFVVEILQTFFRMDREQATQVMLHVHTRGKGVCGVFSRDVAETKVDQVTEYAREHNHPLMCTMEPA